MNPSPPDPKRIDLDGIMANPKGAAPTVPASPSDQQSPGRFDDPNPYAIAAFSEPPPVKSYRHLSVNEIIGAVITGLVAAGAAFFATCAGGAFALQGVGSLFGPTDSGLGTVIVIGTLFVIPLIIAVIAFYYVFRSYRK